MGKIELFRRNFGFLLEKPVRISLNTPLTKMLSGGKYEVLRRDIEELAIENWLSRLYIFNQGGVSFVL